MAYDLDVSDIPEFDQSGDSGEAAQTVTNDAPKADAQPQAQTYKYTANGKEISEDIDTILQRASMGYNYAQHMNQLKADKEAFESERQSIYSSRDKWEQYDKYATENPDWAEFVKNQWENRLSNVEQNAEGKSALDPSIKAELDQLKAFKAKVEDNFRLQEEAKEDAILQKQFDEIAKDYPDYDLKHTDPKTGMSLEMQILEHARINGIHSVKAAFRDLMHDDLVSKAITKAKEQTAKDLAARSKQGFLAESNQPLLKRNLSTRSKGSSYFDDVMLGAQELGIN